MLVTQTYVLIVAVLASVGVCVIVAIGILLYKLRQFDKLTEQEVSDENQT